MARFMRARGMTEYAELWQWSVDDLAGFWAAIWDEFEVGGEHGEVLADASMPGAVWFPGTTLNYAERLFRGKPGDRVAIRHASEARPLGAWTWDELRAQTAAIRAGLVARGVGRGDRVAAYLPNIPETIAAFLATASLGAIWSSAAPEFGRRSVIDRFAQIEPAVLLAIDGYRYGGKDFDRARGRRRDRGGDRRAGRHARPPRRHGLGGGLPRRRPARVRAGPVRPPAVGALLERHDRAAQGDRPGPGRHPARAPQEDAPAPRPAARTTASSGSRRRAG